MSALEWPRLMHRMTGMHDVYLAHEETVTAELRLKVKNGGESAVLEQKWLIRDYRDIKEEWRPVPKVFIDGD